jgi:hypothetical protein
MVRQIIAVMVILIFMFFTYTYSVNYVSGKLETVWLEQGIFTTLDLGAIIAMAFVGGCVGYGVNWLIKQFRKAI